MANVLYQKLICVRCPTNNQSTHRISHHSYQNRKILSVSVKSSCSPSVFCFARRSKVVAMAESVRKGGLSVDEEDASYKAQVEAVLQDIKWDEKGLVVAIAQHVETGAVLMQAFANKDAIAKTLSSRKATFYSRSRSSLWTKGETSLNYINVVDVFLDCDSDSIIYLGKPDGPTCHTGEETCYFKSVSDLLKIPKDNAKKIPLTTLYSLESTISQRKRELISGQGGNPSWTKKLLSDPKLLCLKIREEANELCQTLEENEEKSRTASEMADVLYHTMVLLAVKNVKMEEVLEILHSRFAQSGIEEKKNRR